MSKELYAELQKRVETARAAIKDAEIYADQNGLILEFDFGNSNHYIPDVPLNEIVTDGTRSWRIDSLRNTVEYFNEDEEGNGDRYYEEEFRGQWVTSSTYCD